MVRTMNGFIFRVCAYHGEPVVMNGSGLHARSGLSIDTPVTGDRIVNDPNNHVIKDMSKEGAESPYGIDALLADFEDEYGCKVNYDDEPKVVDGLQVFEFDVFEPSWPDDDEAKDVIDDLTESLVDWAEGYPTGR
jgi:hypothetical protein